MTPAEALYQELLTDSPIDAVTRIAAALLDAERRVWGLVSEHCDEEARETQLGHVVSAVYMAVADWCEAEQAAPATPTPPKSVYRPGAEWEGPFPDPQPQGEDTPT